PGSGIVLWAVFEETVMGGDSRGARGKRAEVVGEEAANMLVEDIDSGAVLDRHASDMIPLYLALAGGEYWVYGARLTMHALTVMDLLSIMIDGFRYRVEEGRVGEPFKAVLAGPGV
ncbi:MAG: RNA 3'-phosphate cyclase, partial [Desulfurococcales archaeon]|nr:RNA 3'-phosphate cyclase [Desulfurococcales archaeon]